MDYNKAVDTIILTMNLIHGDNTWSQECSGGGIHLTQVNNLFRISEIPLYGGVPKLIEAYDLDKMSIELLVDILKTITEVINYT